MAKIYRLVCAGVIFLALFSSQGQGYAQSRRVTRETSTSENDDRQPLPTRGRLWRVIAVAVLEALCSEYGDCHSSGTPAETSRPETPRPETSRRENERYLTPGFGGANTKSEVRQRGFSFATPLGWQSYEDQSSVTVAQPSEYSNGNLTNGVILGLFDLNGGSFEAGNEKYVTGLISNNRYLKRVGWSESDVVNNVPCITTRMEGQSPQTHYFEKVVVYACKRNTQKLFYVVTVNSGPNANQFEGENNRITQSISFR